MKHGLVYLLLVAGVVLTGSLPFASHDVGSSARYRRPWFEWKQTG